MNDNNPWAYWQARQAGENPPAIVDEPQCGYYRWWKKDSYGGKRYSEPVIYWREDGQMHCNVGKWKGEREPSEDFAKNLWNSINQDTISKDLFERVAARGEPWPDDPGLGHNRPPDDDSFEGLRATIEEYRRQAEKRLEGPPIADQTEADFIANLTDILAELHTKAKTACSTEKKPHDEAAAQVQKKWEPLLTLAEIYKDLKRKLLTPWAKQQQEAAKQEAEAAAATGDTAATEPRRSRMGTRGRTMTLRSFKRAEIVDYDACFAFFKDNSDLRDVITDMLRKLTLRAANAGITVPGTEVITDEKVV